MQKADSGDLTLTSLLTLLSASPQGMQEMSLQLDAFSPLTPKVGLLPASLTPPESPLSLHP